MGVPPDENGTPADEGVSLEKPAPEFDPYRFGAPEHPVPPEYAPPGYMPPPPTAPPNTGPPNTPPPGTSPPPPYGDPSRPGQQYPAYPQYGAPPPQYSQYPRPATGNGKAVAGLVLGIVSIVFCWTTFFDAVPVILGLIFGILGLNQSAGLPNRHGRGMAVAGIVCSVVGAALAIALTVWVLHLANQCGGFGGNSSELQTCIQNHI